MEQQGVVQDLLYLDTPYTHACTHICMYMYACMYVLTNPLVMPSSYYPIHVRHMHLLTLPVAVNTPPVCVYAHVLVITLTNAQLQNLLPAR